MNQASSHPIYCIIPGYNEANHISKVVREALDYLPVIVIDDGSTDHTAQLAIEAGAIVLTQSPNQGKGKALKIGFEHALALNCEAIIMLDADGQHDPTEIHTFLDCYQKTHADLIIGERDFSKMPIFRRTSNTIGRHLLSWAIGQYIPDNQSGYRLVSKRLMSAMLESKEAGFEFEVDMVIRCIRMKYSMQWVKIKTIYAGEKSHIKPLHLVANFFRLIFQVLREK